MAGFSLPKTKFSSKLVFCTVTTYVSEDISENFIQSTISKASLLTLNAIESITNLFNYSHDRELTNERNCDAKIQVEKDFDVKVSLK